MGSAVQWAALYSGQRRTVGRTCIVLRSGEKTFKLAVGDREEMVSVDRLKPHMGIGPLQLACPLGYSDYDVVFF